MRFFRARANWVNTTVPNSSKGVRGYIGEIDMSSSTVIQKDFNSMNALLGLSGGSHQIDFQIEAINGYLNSTPMYVPPIGVDPNSTPVIIVNTSGWSDTQTITIGSSEPTATATTNISPTPTASPSPPQNPTATPDLSGPQSVDWMQVATVALLGVIAILLVIVVVFLHRRSVNKPPSSNGTLTSFRAI